MERNDMQQKIIRILDLYKEKRTKWCLKLKHNKESTWKSWPSDNVVCPPQIDKLNTIRAILNNCDKHFSKTVKNMGQYSNRKQANKNA